MKCIFIFNNLNDIVYTKYSKKFAKHLNKFAFEHDLLQDTKQNETDNKLATNIIMQIFSPIVTSQRIMSSQFGNSYTSCHCENGLNIVFDQYMSYIFVSIGEDDIEDIKRLLGICISFVRHLCGADVSLLQTNKFTSVILSRLLDSWSSLYDNDQAVLVEAVEQLMVNAELSSATLRALKEATGKLRTNSEYSKMHAMITVQNKFLSLYSSRNAQDLSAADIMFLNILCASIKPETKVFDNENDDSDGSEEFFSPSSSPQNTPEHSVSSKYPNSFQVLLMGAESSPKCLPHVVHINTLTEDVNLIILIELGNSVISSGLYEAFLYLTTIQNIQMHRDAETLRTAFENLDIAIKKTNDGLKKIKNSTIEACQKKMFSKWEFIRKKYQEFVKNGDANCILRAESNIVGLLDALKELLTLICFDKTVLHSSISKMKEIVKHVDNKLTNFRNFLKVKALRNLSLGHRASLTINKYLEEFPGLVHFLYIDRSNHRITTPSLDFNSEETVTLTKKKIWSMVKFCRSHLQKGHLSIMWKDTTFNYAYFLWFEDKAGSPLKPKIFPNNSVKPSFQPGVLCGDFYQKLIEVCFPKLPLNRVRCYELFCIHLGLVTSSCVLEHSRRLAATIWEIIGVPNNPIDLL